MEHPLAPSGSRRESSWVRLTGSTPGTPPKEECMSLFIRKEDQHSEDQPLANAWSKDYIRVEREGSSRRLVRRESTHDANKKVAKAKWPKSGALLNDQHPKAGVCVNEEAAPQLVTNRERRNKSGPLAASVRVNFMQFRPSMCRWPIGDPKRIETFRFCGSTCSSGSVYCKAHTARAHAPNHPRTPRTTNFRYNPVRVA
jgi:hypothetical protein